MTGKLPDNGDHPELSKELQQFAADLLRLSPRDDRLDRERLAFLAGQASVTPAPSKLLTLGLSLESRAWPAAFASMTAIAATLLCMLLTRPDVHGPSSIAVDSHMPDRQHLSVERISDHAVLATGDVYLADIEARLAKLDAKQSADDMSVSPMDHFTRPVLTPAAWQQVIHETESAKPSPRKSSSTPYFQGVST